MNGLHSDNSTGLTWPTEGHIKVPYQIYFDPEIYELEQEKIFKGPTWSYVGLEAEVPKPGDFRTTFIGDTPVVVSRDNDGSLHVFVNRCAHRGALVCREPRGNHRTHVCGYHQWSYDLQGNLKGVPFKKGIEGKGGYADDFDPSEHSLQKLKVDTYDGLIFASFDPNVEALYDYLGPAMRPWLDRVLNRPIRVLGYTRQFIESNWKLYAENVRDPYHASLLHLFHTTFGIYRSSQGGGVIMDEKGRHHIIQAYKRAEADEVSAYKDADLRTFQEQYKLSDPSLLEGRKEFEKDYTSIHSIFPCLVVQQIQNTLATRHILPKAADKFELLVTYFGYEDDDEEMLNIRHKQANLIGPAGLISMEDGYASEIVQQSIVHDKSAGSYLELGGRDVSDQENLVTETGIRGFYEYYRGLMGLN